jgi:hypothetical protein
MKTGQMPNVMISSLFMKVDSCSSRLRRGIRVFGILLGLALLLSSVHGKKDAYVFKFGLMSLGAQGTPLVYLETTEIEKHTDPSYFHGFTIKRKNGAQFFSYFKVRFPEALESIPPIVYEHYTVLENARVLQSKEELVWELVENFVFDKSDPVGAYEIEIYTDGDLYRKINYNVSSVTEF